MTFADLHMHSTASDGALGVSAMLEQARASGTRVVSITDHDSVAGCREALALSESLGVAVVPGVEVSTQYDGRDVHMLGYFLDVDAPCLDAFFAACRMRREQRALAMADRLFAAGYPVDADALAGSGQTVNRSTLARLLVSAGCASSIDDAFERLIGKGSPFYIETAYPSAEQAIALIHEAGGFAFIAHPAYYGVIDVIDTLAACGLDGLEAFHSLQTPDQSAELVLRANSLGLAVSGGSDWHGDDSHEAYIGKTGLDECAFSRFCHALGHDAFLDGISTCMEAARP